MAGQASRLEPGKAVFDQVYGGVVAFSPEQKKSAFSNLMLENCFAEVWGGETMSIRDRRLILIGVIAAIADPAILEIQFGAARKKGELAPEQLLDGRAN